MSLLLLLLFLLIIFSFFYQNQSQYSNHTKGMLAEKTVARKLSSLDTREYYAFHDLLIVSETRKSQIDHIVVSRYGIFVIETKNYSGWIFGREKSEYWVQYIYQKKIRFRNPIKQNQAHIDTLKTVLTNNKKINYYSIIVFTKNARLKNIKSQLPVVYVQQLLKTIREKAHTPILSYQQMQDIVYTLKKNNREDKNERQEYIREVKRRIQQVRENEDKLICPRCHKPLVIRSGPYSTFYGCSNYPKCRYTCR